MRRQVLHTQFKKASEDHLRQLEEVDKEQEALNKIKGWLFEAPKKLKEPYSPLNIKEENKA